MVSKEASNEGGQRRWSASARLPTWMDRVSTKYFVALLSDFVCVCVYLRAAAAVVVAVVV